LLWLAELAILLSVLALVRLGAWLRRDRIAPAS
jgi:hypothetical protein